METTSDPGSSHDVGLNPSPHSSTTVEVVSSGETLTTSKTLPNWEGSHDCISSVGEFGTSQVQDSNPSPIAGTMVARIGNDELSKNTSSKFQDPNPGPLTNPTAEVMSGPRGRDPLPGG